MTVTVLKRCPRPSQRSWGWGNFRIRWCHSPFRNWAPGRCVTSPFCVLKVSTGKTFYENRYWDTFWYWDTWFSTGNIVPPFFEVNSTNGAYASLGGLWIGAICCGACHSIVQTLEVLRSLLQTKQLKQLVAWLVHFCAHQKHQQMECFVSVFRFAGMRLWPIATLGFVDLNIFIYQRECQIECQIEFPDRMIEYPLVNVYITMESQIEC